MHIIYIKNCGRLMFRSYNNHYEYAKSGGYSDPVLERMMYPIYIKIFLYANFCLEMQGICIEIEEQSGTEVVGNTLLA